MQAVVLLIVLFNRENEEMVLQAKGYVSHLLFLLNTALAMCQTWAKIDQTQICFFLTHSIFFLFMCYFSFLLQSVFLPAVVFFSFFPPFLFEVNLITFSFTQSFYSCCFSLHHTFGLDFHRYGAEKCFSSSEVPRALLNFLMKLRFSLENVHVVKHLGFSEIYYGFQSTCAEWVHDVNFSRAHGFGLPCSAQHPSTALLARSSQHPACPAPLLGGAGS